MAMMPIKKNKVKEAINSIKDKRVLFLDNYENNKNNIKQVNKVHQFKKTNLYKTLINTWPKGVCTSCIVLNRDLLNEFFKKSFIYNSWNWSFLRTMFFHTNANWSCFWRRKR